MNLLELAVGEARMSFNAALPNKLKLPFGIIVFYEYNLDVHVIQVQYSSCK